MSYEMHISELLEKESLQESDIFIIEDSQNTKIVTLRNLIKSIITDNEVATDYRIYSAKKIQDAIDTIDTYCKENIGGLQGDIKKLNKLTATKTELENLQLDLMASIDGKVDEDFVNTAVETRMPKTYKIKSSDLDTSSDAYKIKLANLAQEVIDVLTGEIAYEVTNKAPKGGWTSDDIAVGTIVSSRLSDSYRFRQTLTEGTINDCLKDGIYILSHQVEGLPKENSSDKEMRILEVDAIGEDYVIQTVRYLTNIYSTVYRRKGKTDKIHSVEFERIQEITESSPIKRSMLSDLYNTIEEKSNINIYTIKKECRFIANSTCKGLPSQDKYYVEVSCFDDSTFIYTAYNMSTSKCEVYKSMVYKSGSYSVTSEWFKVTSSKKSKFDGKNLHIFGDDIIYGIGSTDIPNLSIPALLKSRYGFNVTNCALQDATAGDYDDILAKSSLNAQINATNVVNSDYVLIFVGTNDYRSGKTIIGSDDSVDTLTFKGGLNLVIQKLYSQNPSIKIMLATPIYRNRLKTPGDGRNSNREQVNNLYLSDFSNAIVELGKYNHIPVLNLLDTCNINMYNADQYLSDGLHLNNEGQSMITDKIFDGFNNLY